MDQQLFNLVVGGANLLLGWLLKVIWDSVTDLKREDKALAEKVNNIEVLVAGDYVRKHDFEEAFKEVKLMLGKIFDKLDGKADK